LHVVCTGKFKQ